MRFHVHGEFPVLHMMKLRFPAVAFRIRQHDGHHGAHVYIYAFQRDREILIVIVVVKDRNYNVLSVKTGKSKDTTLRVERSHRTVLKNCQSLSYGDHFLVKMDQIPVLMSPGERHCTKYEGTVLCERTVIYCDLPVLGKEYLESHRELINKLSVSGKVLVIKKGMDQIDALIDSMLTERFHAHRKQHP